MRRRALPVLFVVTVAAVLPVALSSPALAQQGGCVVNPVTLQCEINVPVEIPGDPGGGGGPVGGPNPGGGGGGGPQAPPPPDPEAGGSAANNCTWQTVAGPAAEVYREQLGASADAVIQICAGGDGMGGPLYRQVPPGEEDAPAAPPDPETLALSLLATAQADMHAPTVHADPPLDTPSIITLPVFVEVTNWVGAFDTPETCVGGVCVVLTATPTLTYEPGEPGSDPKVCTPPGTRFDPNGADPVVQAQVPGACAHVYETRTGAAGRPPAWPAQVTITWAIAWQATGVVEAEGTFPDESLSTGIPRAVDEVQTVVVDQGGR